MPQQEKQLVLQALYKPTCREVWNFISYHDNHILTKDRYDIFLNNEKNIFIPTIPILFLT